MTASLSSRINPINWAKASDWINSTKLCWDDIFRMALCPVSSLDGGERSISQGVRGVGKKCLQGGGQMILVVKVLEEITVDRLTVAENEKGKGEKGIMMKGADMMMTEEIIAGKIMTEEMIILVDGIIDMMIGEMTAEEILAESMTGMQERIDHAMVIIVKGLQHRLLKLKLLL